MKLIVGEDGLTWPVSSLSEQPRIHRHGAFTVRENVSRHGPFEERQQPQARTRP
jgi:hypothetical protein